jgi:ferredoxin
MDETTWRVTVDHNRCAGTGMCAAAAADYFRLHEGKSHPVREVVASADILLDAAEVCPMEAITVSDAAGVPRAPRD